MPKKDKALDWYDINNFQEIHWEDVIPDQKIYYISGNLKDGNPTRVYGPYSVYDPVKRILIGKSRQTFYERWHCLYIQKRRINENSKKNDIRTSLWKRT